MTDVNPYASPTQFNSAVIEQVRVRRVGIVVLVHFVLTAWLICSNWSELTWLHHLFGTVLWFVLPLTAFYLVSRKRSLGRWILVGLFALRALGCLSILAMFFSHGVPSVPILVTRLIRYIIQALAYVAATAWLLFSPTMRQRPKTPGASDA